jgi:hypothetical protein
MPLRRWRSPAWMRDQACDLGRCARVPQRWSGCGPGVDQVWTEDRRYLIPPAVSRVRRRHGSAGRRQPIESVVWPVRSRPDVRGWGRRLARRASRRSPPISARDNNRSGRCSACSPSGVPGPVPLDRLGASDLAALSSADVLQPRRLTRTAVEATAWGTPPRWRADTPGDAKGRVSCTCASPSAHADVRSNPMALTSVACLSDPSVEDMQLQSDLWRRSAAEFGTHRLHQPSLMALLISSTGRNPYLLRAPTGIRGSASPRTSPCPRVPEPPPGCRGPLG